MIANKNKRLEITLTSEELDLLNSLSSRFNITKTQVIKQALKVFASKRKHYLTISYKEISEYEETPGKKARKKEEMNKNQISDEEWKKIVGEEPKEEKEDTNDLPF